jgi:hypothetical protein
MREHKIRQSLYHKIAKLDDILDDVEKAEPVIYNDEESPEETIRTIIRYFREDVKELIYPAKPYVVALVYACLLERYFCEPFYESISDADLLHGNDKWFKPYNEETSNVYEAAIHNLGLELDFIVQEETNFLPSQIKATIGYFKEEFLIDGHLPVLPKPPSPLDDSSSSD